jgi:hypothetical protein
MDSSGLFSHPSNEQVATEASAEPVEPPTFSDRKAAAHTPQTK